MPTPPTSRTSVVVALFDDYEHARRAIEALAEHGVPRENIDVVAPDPTGELGRTTGAHVVEPKHRTRAGEGAVAGGMAGLIGGIIAMAIPGVGPVLAIGTLGGAIAAAGLGAVAGGLLGALVHKGVPREEAELYMEGVRRGGTLLAVTVASEGVHDIVSELEFFHPVDVAERSASWREEGWVGFDPTAEPLTPEALEREHRAPGGPVPEHARLARVRTFPPPDEPLDEAEAEHRGSRAIPSTDDFVR